MNPPETGMKSDRLSREVPSGRLLGIGSFCEGLKNVKENVERSQRSLGKWLKRMWQTHLPSPGSAGLLVAPDS